MSVSLDAVAAFTPADQLHQYALNVNMNDGLSPIRALAAHPACDRCGCSPHADVHRYRQRGLAEFMVPVVGRAVDREWRL